MELRSILPRPTSCPSPQLRATGRAASITGAAQYEERAPTIGGNEAETNLCHQKLAVDQYPGVVSSVSELLLGMEPCSPNGLKILSMLLQVIIKKQTGFSMEYSMIYTKNEG